jgi:hypothetical protein
LVCHYNLSMAPIERDQVFQLRLSKTERDVLQKLADNAGVSASDWVRLRIREALVDKMERNEAKRSKR